MVNYHLDEDEAILLFSDQDVEVYDQIYEIIRLDKVLLTNKNLVFYKKKWNKEEIKKLPLKDISIADGIPSAHVVKNDELGVVMKVFSKASGIVYLSFDNNEDAKIWAAKIRNQILSDIGTKVKPEEIRIVEDGDEPVNMDDCISAFKDSAKDALNSTVNFILKKDINESRQDDMKKETTKEETKEKSEKRFCIECGQEIKSTDKYCLNCGTKVN